MTIQHTAILQGEYLRGTRVLVTLDPQGRILDSSGITCVWKDTPRFDDWFRANYNPTILYDGGEEYRAWSDWMSGGELLAAA